MGSISLDSDNPDHERALVGEVVRLEAKYSRYLPTSFLSEINAVAAEGGSIQVDEETAALFDYAFEVYSRSDGLFDISSGLLRKAWNFPIQSLPSEETIKALLDRIGLDKVVWENPKLTFAVSGMELDLGGLVKEYAVDRCIDIGRALGIENILVNLAGDIRASGLRTWPVDIASPASASESAITISLVNAAMATSGNYARMSEIDGKKYGHILNPKTGWPIEGLTSVTVVAPSCMVAGTFTTIAMLTGEPAKEWLVASGFGHRWVDAQGAISGTLDNSL